MSGDALARGARSATFGPAKKVSQTKWDAIWAEEPVVEFHTDKIPATLPAHSGSTLRVKGNVNGEQS